MQYKIHIDLALFISDLANESLNFNEKITIWKRFVVFANKDASLSDLKLVICDTFIELYPDQGNIYIFGHLKDSSLADLSDRFKIEEVLDTAERKLIVFCTIGQIKRKLECSESKSNVIVNGQMTEGEENELKRKKSLANEALNQHVVTSSEQITQLSPLKVYKEIDNKDAIDHQSKSVEKNAKPTRVFNESSKYIPNIESLVKLTKNQTEMQIVSIPPESVTPKVFSEIKKTPETIESTNITGSNINASEVATNITGSNINSSEVATNTAESRVNLDNLHKPGKIISTFENITVPKEPFQSTYKIEMHNGSQILNDCVNPTEISKTSDCNLISKATNETSGHCNDLNTIAVQKNSAVSDEHFKKLNDPIIQKHSSGSKNLSVHSDTKDSELNRKNLSNFAISKQTQSSENKLEKPQDKSRSDNQKQLFIHSNETNQNIIKTVSTKKQSVPSKRVEPIVVDKNDSVTKFSLNQSLENSSNSSSVVANSSPSKTSFKPASNITDVLSTDKKSLNDDLSTSNKSSNITSAKKHQKQKSQPSSKDLSSRNTLSSISTNSSSVSLTKSISDISLKPSAPYPSVKEILLSKKSAIRKSVPITKAQETIATQAKPLPLETFDESSSECEEASSSNQSSLIYSSKLFK